MKNGEFWYDTDGNIIHAHGGWILKVGEYYYWYGENRSEDIYVSCYRTKDFKTFETEPEILYGRWNEVDPETGETRNVQCIDGDIVFNEKDGYYYLFFKEDLTQKIAFVKSKNLTGPYNTDYTICSLNWFGVEGSSMYQSTGTDSWVMIMDEYSEGTFFAQQTKDFENWRQVRRSTYALDQLSPRHGSVVAISEDEYRALIDAYGVAD